MSNYRKEIDDLPLGGTGRWPELGPPPTELAVSRTVDESFGMLLVSNVPETFTTTKAGGHESGVLAYGHVTTEGLRVFIHHVNGTSLIQNVYIVFKNPGSNPVQLMPLGHGHQKRSPAEHDSYTASAGKYAVAGWWMGYNPSYGLIVQPGGHAIHPVATGLAPPAGGGAGDVVAAVCAWQVWEQAPGGGAGELEIQVIATPGPADWISDWNAPENVFAPHEGDASRCRAVFAANTVRILGESVWACTGPEPAADGGIAVGDVELEDALFSDGVNPLDRDEQGDHYNVLHGMYGVQYLGHVTVTNTYWAVSWAQFFSALWNPRGGVFGGVAAATNSPYWSLPAIDWQDDGDPPCAPGLLYHESCTQTPVTHKATKVERRMIPPHGLEHIQFRIMPPGGSALPVVLRFVQAPVVSSPWPPPPGPP